jgi:hypothetical protein
VYLCIGFNPKQIKNMGYLQEDLDSIREFDLVQGDDYLQVLAIQLAIQKKDWEEVAQKAEELQEKLEIRHELNLASNLRNLMLLILEIKEFGITNPDDRSIKVQGYYRLTRKLSYLMSVRTLFTKEYLLQNEWQDAWQSTKEMFEGMYPKRKISYVLDWNDVFETDYFPINE